MTSDAKIGLLLGLAFIFIIAFLINGLPRFRDGANNNELTTDSPVLEKEPPGLAAWRDDVQEAFNEEGPSGQIGPIKNPSPGRFEQLHTSPPPGTVAATEDVRFATPVPDSPPPAGNIGQLTTTEEVNTISVGPTDDKTKVKTPGTVQPASTKTYIVVEGDNLGVIARRCYGPKQGNRIANVMRIFKANSPPLKSPDEIYVGQKLVIPPLPASTPDNSQSEGLFPGRMFEQVSSIGRRNILSESNKAGQVIQTRQYVVKEGDSLWQIAARELGAGSRYKEISKLNAGILKDEDDIRVGMRLRIPVR